MALEADRAIGSGWSANRNLDISTRIRRVSDTLSLFDRVRKVKFWLLQLILQNIVSQDNSG
jgi:hypothetical protein